MRRLRATDRMDQARVIPVPGVPIGTPYGRRGPYWSCDRDAYGNGIHTGCDYPAPTGTKVVAARPGKAVYSNHGSAFGYHQLDIVCDDGTRDFYAHMTTRTVANGSRVEAGQQVGKVGAEGNVTGPHLHFERHATTTGGWSCSVVRDPAPSLNYQPAGSGGSGAGTEDDDMPEYTTAKATKAKTLRDGEWTPITWDANSNEKYFDGAGILIAGCKYSATLTVDLSGRSGAVVDTSWVEVESGDVVETSMKVVHGAYDACGETRNGSVGKGRRLRARVRVRGHDATLKTAKVALLVWRP